MSLFRIRNVFRRELRPGWRFSPRSPDYHTLVWVERGALDLWVDGNRFRIEAGQVLLIPANCEKRGGNPTRKSGYSHTVLFFGPLPESFYSRQGNLILHPPLEEMSWVFETLHRHWLSDNRFSADAYVEALVGILPPPLSIGTQRAKDPRVERMRQYLIDHLEEPVRLDTLAEVANLSRAYAGTLFHESTGVTVQNYANALRVQKARTLLCESWDTVEAIGYACGFQDPFYFSKVFKKHTGHSPHRFRKKFGD